MTTVVGSTVDCLVSWAGPVDLPLRDEADVQAACGIMHVHGRRYGRPTPLGVDYASMAAGLLAVQGGLAARLGGMRGVAINRVSTSVAQAALLSVSQYLAAATADDPEQAGEQGGPPFTSADDVRFEVETLDAEPWLRFWTLLGAPEFAVRQGWRAFQHRFATATCPLPAELHATARAAGFAAVTDVAARTGVSAVAVRDLWVESPVRPWEVSAVSGARAAPGLGTGTGLPLDGLVVVESCRRVQGPLAGHLLRLLGATVVRVEPPGGDPMRWVPPMSGDCSARFRALNRGKHVVEADITTPAGRAAVRELVSAAHVFLHNWAPGKASALGLAAADLARVRPGLVYAWASGWGDRLGPHPPIGTDYVVQAHSGLAAAAGPSLMTLTDVLGGLVCASGVLSGLVARARTGLSQRVDSSLLSAALTARYARVAEPRTPSVEVCTDLAALAADPRFAPALEHDGCWFVRAPWEFE
jgi:crotonobetainyl-CoA:carnitine CoA-transferase CaiB-like acyl-CoA transferase